VDKKKVLIIACIVILIFSAGLISGQVLHRRTIRTLEVELETTANRLGEYKADISQITERLGESQESLETERIRNTGYIESIERLQAELTASERRNREIIAGVGTVQEGLGGIARRANSSTGLVDGCLEILEEARDD